ncbi:MAG: hypothetical protein AB7G76_12865 [Steroidobacteraceae bacterium]
MKESQHARRRARERGIPPLILQWLSDYGREHYDGHGGRVVWFDKASRRRIEREAGREAVRRMYEFLDAYAVLASSNDQIITVGHRYKRVRV